MYLLSVYDVAKAYDALNNRQITFEGPIKLNNHIVHNWLQPLAITVNSSIKLGKNKPVLVTKQIIDYALKNSPTVIITNSQTGKQRNVTH